MSTATKLPEPKTLYTLAREALEAHDFDRLAATEQLYQDAQNDELMWKRLVEPLIHKALREIIDHSAGQERHEIWTAPNYDPGGKGDRLRRVIDRGLSDFRLHDGTRLADATAEQLQAEKERYEKQAQDMAHKGRWFGLILQRIKSGKTVGQSLSEKQLQELREEAAA